LIKKLVQLLMVNAKTSKEDAILKAKEAFPQWANDATETKVEYHLVARHREVAKRCAGFG
jgi:hypothetical protein